MSVYRQAHRECSIRVRITQEDWQEMYLFWLACHGKKDTLINCLKFMAMVPV